MLCHTDRVGGCSPLPFTYFFPLVASFSFSLLVQLLHKAGITRFPCSSNSCCFDSSLNPALMLMADDRQRKQQLHFRGQYITSVYCLLRPPCRASGILSSGTDMSLETSLLSPEPLLHWREEGKAAAVTAALRYACTQLTVPEMGLTTTFAPELRQPHSESFLVISSQPELRHQCHQSCTEGRPSKQCRQKAGPGPQNTAKPCHKEQGRDAWDALLALQEQDHTCPELLLSQRSGAAPLAECPVAPSRGQGGLGLLFSFPLQQKDHGLAILSESFSCLELIQEAKPLLCTTDGN